MSTCTGTLPFPSFQTHRHTDTHTHRPKKCSLVLMRGWHLGHGCVRYGGYRGGSAGRPFWQRPSGHRYVCVYVDIYVYVYMHLCIYIYVCVRARREWGKIHLTPPLVYVVRVPLCTCVSLCVCMQLPWLAWDALACAFILAVVTGFQLSSVFRSSAVRRQSTTPTH
jgi:hypothetical protein